MEAAEQGNLESVRALLEAGTNRPGESEDTFIADLESTNNQGQTALHIAAECHHLEIVDIMKKELFSRFKDTWTCPITSDICTSPVRVRTTHNNQIFYHTFEEESLETWRSTCNSRGYINPVNNLIITDNAYYKIDELWSEKEKIQYLTNTDYSEWYD